MKHFLCLFLFFLGVKGADDCLTPTQQFGKCVLINHCPHLFSTMLQNQSEAGKNLVKKSHCGFAASVFPKVCCPLEAVKYYDEGGAISQNQYATKCGLHEPDGPSDPWLGLLEYETVSKERLFLCGGVLINKRYVLTAAHCIKGRGLPPNVKLTGVHFGKFGDSKQPAEVFQVDSTTVHEDYSPDDPNQYNDVALVRLKGKVSFKDGNVRPICIGTTNKDFAGKTFAVTGYEKSGDVAKKRDGLATIWNNTECRLVYHVSEVQPRNSQICAGGRRSHQRHSYRMDYGGILMHVARDNSYSAVGILSLAPPCCENDNYPKVYTRVGSYIDWIFENLKV